MLWLTASRFSIEICSLDHIYSKWHHCQGLKGNELNQKCLWRKFNILTEFEKSWQKVASWMISLFFYQHFTDELFDRLFEIYAGL